MSNARISHRFFIIKLLIAIQILSYFGYTFYIQIIRGFSHRENAQQLITTDRIIPAKRGNIYDRNGALLATSQLFFQIAVVPALQTEKQLALLSSLFPDQWDQIEATLQKKSGSFALVPIVDRVSHDLLFQLVEQIDNPQSIQWYPQLERDYPVVNSFTHVVGHVGSISSTEYQVRVNEGYVQTSDVGKLGVEAIYESILRGADGQVRGRVDATGRLIENFGSVDNAVTGNDIYLTIDVDIQRLAEDALGDRMGAVVVLDPKTSEVLAMVSYPSYDSNVLLDRSTKNAFAQFENDSRAPFLNRAVQTAVAPASTFKIVTSLALLQQDGFSPYDSVFCDGNYRLGNRLFHCWYEPGHKGENLFTALANSCNVYFYTMANRHLTGDALAKVALELGFGAKTGIDLIGEESGLVPTSQWKEQYLDEVWQGGDTVNMSIGQGYLTATPMQLAMLITRIMNGGKAYQPHLLKEIRDNNSNEVLEEHALVALPESDSISADHWGLLRNMMRQVVVNGTVKTVMTTDIVSIAGKTGTGQVGSTVEGFTSWFAAYAPHNPSENERQVVVVVMIDSTNEWDWWAPKAANFIFHGIFADTDLEETVAQLRDIGGLWYLP